MQTGAQRWAIEMPVSGETLAFSPRGDTVLTGDYGGKAYLYDAASGALVREIVIAERGAVYISRESYSPDGRYVVIGAPGGPVTIWDVQTGAEVRRFLGHTGASFGIFSPDGRYVLSCADNIAPLWAVDSGRELRRFAGHTQYVPNVAYAPDGRVVATVGREGVLRLWYTDIDDTIADLCGRLLRDLTAEEREMYGITDEAPTCPLRLER